MSNRRLQAVALPVAAMAFSTIVIVIAIMYASGNSADAQSRKGAPIGLNKGTTLSYLRLDNTEFEVGKNCEEISVFHSGYNGWTGIIVTENSGLKGGTKRYYLNNDKIELYTVDKVPSYDRWNNSPEGNDPGGWRGNAASNR